MNTELQRGIIKAYNNSGKDRRKFEREVEKNTGLKKHVLYRQGQIADLVSTFIFKENKKMNRLKLGGLVKRILEASKINKNG